MSTQEDPFARLEKEKAYYDYLYLDDIQALDALSSAAGGIEGDRTIEVTRDRGGSAELKYSGWGVSLGLGGRGSRKQRQQFINRQTIHSQMRKLFDATDPGVAMVEEDRQLKWLKEGYLVRFDAYIRPLPGVDESLVIQDSRWIRLGSNSFWSRIRTMFRWSNPEEEEHRRRREMIGDERFVCLAQIFDKSGMLGNETIALELVADYVMIARKEDFARRATVFGLVTCVPRPDLYELSIETEGRTRITVKYNGGRTQNFSRGEAGETTISQASSGPTGGTSVVSKAIDQSTKDQAVPEPHRSTSAEGTPSARKKGFLWWRGKSDTDADAVNSSEIDDTVGSAVALRLPTPLGLAASVRPTCIYRLSAGRLFKQPIGRLARLSRHVRSGSQPAVPSHGPDAPQCHVDEWFRGLPRFWRAGYGA